MPGTVELGTLVKRLPELAEKARAGLRPAPPALPDYLALVTQHNPRKRRAR